MEALLKVRNLSIDIRRENKMLSSVEDISFDIYPGEILGLVGESGSGKSLTALSITGLLGEGKEVSGGSILYNGNGEGAARDLLRLPEKELQRIRGKEISMIFQEPFSSLNPLVKVGAQIAETMKLHSEKDKNLIKGRVLEFLSKLKFSEPEKIINAYPHRLSGGMCQRAMIALAMICRPRLLIADEPTTALDISTQNQILSLMKEINRELGTSLLFISHDLGVIRELCSRLLVMYSGRILEEGNTEEIFSRPAHEYTRGRLGSLPSRARRGKELANIPGKVPSLEEGRPAGCPFHPRCGKAVPACKGEFPPERLVGTSTVGASASHKTHCVLEETE
jgi:peptide/nickel transport system ATP-binding protein